MEGGVEEGETQDTRKRGKEKKRGNRSIVDFHAGEKESAQGTPANKTLVLIGASVPPILSPRSSPLSFPRDKGGTPPAASVECGGGVQKNDGGGRPSGPPPVATIVNPERRWFLTRHALRLKPASSKSREERLGSLTQWTVAYFFSYSGSS